MPRDLLAPEPNAPTGPRDLLADQAAPEAQASAPAPTITAPERPHTGYAATVRATMSGENAPDHVQARPVADIAKSYGNYGVGIAEGVPAGVAGMPGDIEGAGRAVMSAVGAPVSRETLLPTSENVGDALFGKAPNSEVATGRQIGNVIGPGATAKAWESGAKLLPEAIAGSGPTVQAQKAAAAGFKIPPNMASDHPDIVSSLASGIGGKERIQQSASAKNQARVNDLGAADIGLPQGTRLTVQDLENVRKDAGQAYEAAKTAPITVLPDKAWQEGISKIDQNGKAVREQFGDLVKNPKIDQLVEKLSGMEQTSPEAAVDLAKSLRYQASANLKDYGSPEKLQLGHAQSKAANEIEMLLERNLHAATTAMGPLTGQNLTQLVQDLRDARQTIAKTYDIQDALNPATGNMDARVLGSKINKGKPLTGGLKDAGDAALAFPKAMMPSEKFGGAQAHTALDWLTLLASHGKTAGLSLARPAVRGALLSSPYQNALMGSARNPLARLPSVNAFALQAPEEERQNALSYKPQ